MISFQHIQILNFRICARCDLIAGNWKRGTVGVGALVLWFLHYHRLTIKERERNDHRLKAFYSFVVQGRSGLPESLYKLPFVIQTRYAEDGNRYTVRPH